MNDDAVNEAQATTEEASKTVTESENLREESIPDEAGVEQRIRALAADIKQKVDEEVDHIVSTLRPPQDPPSS